MIEDRRLKKLGNEADVESNPHSLPSSLFSFQSLAKDLASSPASSIVHDSLTGRKRRGVRGQVRLTQKNNLLTVLLIPRSQQTITVTTITIRFPY